MSDSKPGDSAAFRSLREHPLDAAAAQRHRELLSLISEGRELLAADELSEAIEVLERAHALGPTNQKALNLLGVACFKLGSFQRAGEVYDKLVQENPSDPTLRVNLGLVFLKLNDRERAIAEFEAAVGLSPNHKKAQNYLGLAYAQADDFARARDCFMAAGSGAMAEKMERALREQQQAAEEPGALYRPEEESDGEADSAENELSREISIGESIRRAALLHGEESSGYGVEHPQEQTAAAPSATLTGVEVPMEEGGGESLLDDVRVDSAAAVALRDGEYDDYQEERYDQPAQEAAPSSAVSGAYQPSAQQSLLSAPAGGGEVPWRPSIFPLKEIGSTRELAFSEGGIPFELSNDLLQANIEGEMLMRLEGLVAAKGTLAFRPEMKRFKGGATDKAFGEGERRIMRVSGRGQLLLGAEGRRFYCMRLSGESAFLQEEDIVAFESEIEFENGRVPSKVAPDLHLVNLCGEGWLVLAIDAELRSLKVVRDAPCMIPFASLVGWFGDLAPRIVALPLGDAGTSMPAVELSGEGSALLACRMPGPRT